MGTRRGRASRAACPATRSGIAWRVTRTRPAASIRMARGSTPSDSASGTRRCAAPATAPRFRLRDHKRLSLQLHGRFMLDRSYSLHEPRFPLAVACCRHRAPHRRAALGALGTTLGRGDCAHGDHLRAADASHSPGAEQPVSPDAERPRAARESLPLRRVLHVPARLDRQLPPGPSGIGAQRGDPCAVRCATFQGNLPSQPSPEGLA